MVIAPFQMSSWPVGAPVADDLDIAHSSPALVLSASRG